MSETKNCFNCYYRDRTDPINPYAWPYECNTCRHVSETDSTPTNWEPGNQDLSKITVTNIDASKLRLEDPKWT